MHNTIVAHNKTIHYICLDQLFSLPIRRYIITFSSQLISPHTSVHLVWFIVFCTVFHGTPVLADTSLYISTLDTEVAHLPNSFSTSSYALWILLSRRIVPICLMRQFLHKDLFSILLFFLKNIIPLRYHFILIYKKSNDKSSSIYSPPLVVALYILMKWYLLLYSVHKGGYFYTPFRRDATLASHYSNQSSFYFPYYHHCNTAYNQPRYRQRPPAPRRYNLTHYLNLYRVGHTICHLYIYRLAFNAILSFGLR